MFQKWGLLIKSARPRQWTKNLVVFAAIIFSGRLFEQELLLKTVFAFISLCFLSGSIYILNDVLDREKDRLHPKKKNRPIASGAVSLSEGIIALFSFMILSLLFGYLAGTGYLYGAGFYLILQTAYSFFLKNIVLVDIITISAGFVVRAIAGAWTIGVPISPWLLICAALLALFLAASKRRHELEILKSDSSNHRPVLREYSKELLDSLTSTLSAATITSYSLYTFFSHDQRNYRMMLTVPFVIYGVLRYQYLVFQKGKGGRPEEILLRDKPTLINTALWMLTVIWVIYSS